MKVYYSGGNEEFDADGFIKHLKQNSLKIEPGVITHAKILERKFLSNKGNALDGFIQMENCGIGLNIGGNPIGTGHHNYISFLEEMECEKIGPLFVPQSIIGKGLYVLTSGIPGMEYSRGLFTPKGLSKL